MKQFVLSLRERKLINVLTSEAALIGLLVDLPRYSDARIALAYKAVSSHFAVRLKDEKK